MNGISGMGAPNMAAMQEMRTRAFKSSDEDASGGLNLDEFKKLGSQAPQGVTVSISAQATEQAFGKMDTDADGQLTQTELDAGAKAAMESMVGAMGFGMSGDTASLSSGDTSSQLGKLLEQLLSGMENGSREGSSGSTAAWASKVQVSA